MKYRTVLIGMLENIKEISKAEFVRKITGGKSLFIGVSPTMDNGEINAARQRRLERHESRARSCIVKSNNHLVFEGGSHLELRDVKPYTFIKCYATDDDILIVEQKWLDMNWNGNVEDTRYKYLYYVMR